MFKEILVPELTKHDEPCINLVRPGYKEKYASVKLDDDIYKELENFQGEKNKSYMLVVAVSPVEYWGDNKNHDAFEEHWLKKKHHTFTTDGTFFKNHVNKNPLNNYGDNELSWFDDVMKRVLVLVGVDHKKAPDIVDDLESGKKISVSMGCRIAQDVCSICGNRAPTRNEYCDHMKYSAGKILPDGRKVFVYNPDPTFFDLSKVIRPAGHIEYMIKKVNPAKIKGQSAEKEAFLWVPRHEMEKAANFSSYIFDENESIDSKLANIKKLCTMDKVLSGKPVEPDEMSDKLKDVIENSKKIINITEDPDIDDSTISGLSKCPLDKIFSTSNLLGIRFNLPEIMKIVLSKIKDPEVEELLHNFESNDIDIADILGEDSPISYLERNPKVVKIIIKSKVLNDDVANADEKVASLLAPYVPYRSIYPEFLQQRPFLGKFAAQLDPVFLEDAAGRQYVTTREGINAGDENRIMQFIVRNSLKGLGLGTALAGAAAGTMALPKFGGKYMLPAALFGSGTLALKGLNALGLRPPEDLKVVPSDIIMHKVSSVLGNKRDYCHSSVEANEYRDHCYALSYLNKTAGVGNAVDATTQWMSENPNLSIFLGLLGAGAGAKGIQKFGPSALRAIKSIPGSIKSRAATFKGNQVDRMNQMRKGLSDWKTRTFTRAPKPTLDEKLQKRLDAISNLYGKL